MRPVAWWRSTTAIFARSRPGSATTWPSRTVGASSRACVISWPGISITRTRAAAGIAKARAATARRASSCATHRDRRPRNGSRDAVARLHAVLAHATRPERLEVVEQHKVGAEPGAIAPRSSRPWHARSASPSAARPRRDPLAAPRRHMWSMWPRGTGSRARGRRCRTRRSGPNCSTSGSRSRRLRAFEASRIRTHMPRRRSRAPPRMSSPRGRSGSRPPRRRRARGPTTVEHGRRRASHRRARQHAGSPAMTPGKSIISATPSARGCRRIDSHAGRLERPDRRLEVARRHARRRHHEDVAAAAPRAASSSQSTPSPPSTLATSCGSVTTAVVPCGTTARANSAGAASMTRCARARR